MNWRFSRKNLMILRKKEEHILRNLIREKFLIMYKLNTKGGYRMLIETEK